ncbi:MAG: hypothetical protein H6819_12180 [Phycisphaerales bacterium]|nr:hypothetical protein [Phycisphaerales bacterium]MCB9858706.1 hypothetical protein [Phycisphaerales bacterium]MCB9864438.1 hypothetical protein [Phycisphaerales bacterium]
MRNRRSNRLPYLLATIAVSILGAGCAGRTAYQHGIEAEKRGEAHLAYAYYAKAAQSSPDNGTYDRAIRRLGPLAASHWINDAKLARAEGRYDEAWKACMRALAIQPDRSEALSFYDELERDYGSRLAGVKREWKKSGAKALVIQVSPETPPKRAELPEAAMDSPEASDVDARVASDTDRGGPAPTSELPGKFLAHHALSRDGTREVTSVDGIRIRLRDTTEDRAVDFDLYEADRRIQRIRGLKPGESRLLLSPEGKWYRLTVVSVDHSAETAEIGLNPA